MIDPRTGQPAELVRLKSAEPPPRRETLAHALLRQRARVEGRGELTDEQVDAELRETLRPGEPEPPRPAEEPSVQAKHGAAGAAMRTGPRQAAVAAAEETASTLALARLTRGIPMGESRWTIAVMGFWIRDAWPGKAPEPPTVEKHLRGAIRRGLLPPVVEWPVAPEER